MSQYFSSLGKITAVNSSGKHALEILGSTTAVVAVDTLLFGFDAGTPIDEMGLIEITRITTGGTATVVTAQPGNQAGIIARSVSKNLHTVEPTMSGEAHLTVPLHVRAAMQWQARPGHELLSPALAGDGFGVRARAPTYASTAKGTMFFEE